GAARKETTAVDPDTDSIDRDMPYSHHVGCPGSYHNPISAADQDRGKISSAINGNRFRDCYRAIPTRIERIDLAPRCCLRDRSNKSFARRSATASIRIAAKCRYQCPAGLILSKSERATKCNHCQHARLEDHSASLCELFYAPTSNANASYCIRGLVNFRTFR